MIMLKLSGKRFKIPWQEFTDFLANNYVCIWSLVTLLYIYYSNTLLVGKQIEILLRSCFSLII